MSEDGLRSRQGNTCCSRNKDSLSERTQPSMGLISPQATNVLLAHFSSPGLKTRKSIHSMVWTRQFNLSQSDLLKICLELQLKITANSCAVLQGKGSGDGASAMKEESEVKSWIQGHRLFRCDLPCVVLGGGGLGWGREVFWIAAKSKPKHRSK